MAIDKEFDTCNYLALIYIFLHIDYILNISICLSRTNGLKVYYLPVSVVYDQVTYPTFFSFFPLFRNTLIRERINIVHGHQSTSVMANECILFARAMGLKVCFTDHSLFGFADAVSIHLNKLMEITLSDIDHVICVSNTW